MKQLKSCKNESLKKDILVFTNLIELLQMTKRANVLTFDSPADSL